MRDFLSKNYIFYVLLMIVISGVILMWMANERLKDFTKHQQTMVDESVRRVSAEITLFMQMQERMLELFVDRHKETLDLLVSNPTDDAAVNIVTKSVKKTFADHLAFTVTALGGKPLYEDVAKFIGELCIADIQAYTEKQVNFPVIHANTAGFHFDVMQSFPLEKPEAVFVISFHADILSNLLESGQPEGHSLVLVNPAKDSLIEVAAGGARSTMVRTDYRLSDSESARILSRKSVEDTRWELVGLYDKGHYEGRKEQILQESVVLFFIFGVVGVLLAVNLMHEDKKKREALYRTQIADENRRILISVITHEFRTPVATIVGSLNLLAKGSAGVLDDGSAELIDMARNNTRHLQLLIDDFLDLQRLEMGKLQLKQEEAYINEVVERAVTNNAIFGEQYGVKFVYKPPESNKKVFVDVQRIEQVMANLLSNAAKHGGSFNNVDITIVSYDDQVRVNVIDHGNGIAPEFRDHVFDRFTMADKPTYTKGSGSGLGLSICKAIIEAHDGNINFETKVGDGTTFYFELPVVDD